MRRAAGSLLVVIALTAVLMPRAAFAQPITVYINGQPVGFDVPPTIIQGRVLVPLRGIFERLGATVDYDAHTQHIVAIRGQQTVELTIGSRQARVNGTPQLLDVPAFTINGRTMVPLRFISESLGANVQWVNASRTILIGTGAAGPAAPPATSQAQTISGRLMAVTTGQTPRIVVRSNGQDATVAVTSETAIYRYNADTNAGGSAALDSLRTGDHVTAEVNDQDQAVKITATYHVNPGGRVTRVNPDSRTVTLANGRSYVVMQDAEITFNGQSAGFDAVQVGRIARFYVIQGTDRAYEVNVTLPATTGPAPASVAAPTITSPANGATVGSAFVVQGRAQPGALVVVKVQPRLLGQAVQAQTTAGANGSWQLAMNVQSLPFVSFPYVVSAVEILNGTQSDPSSIEVTVQ